MSVWEYIVLVYWYPVNSMIKWHVVTTLEYNLLFKNAPSLCLQISLSVTVLLALTVFLLLVAETLPTQSDSVPLIGQYISGGVNGSLR